MINYYYEIKEDVTVFGKDIKYLAQFDFNPAEAMAYEFKVHDDAVAHSRRVWLENANGVYQVKPDWYGMRGHVDPHEFTLIKLKSRVYKWWDSE